MSVAEDVGPDVDRLADDALDRETPAIDARINVLDQEAVTGKAAARFHARLRNHGLMALAVEFPPGDGTGLIEAPTANRLIWFPSIWPISAKLT
jgi:hypothetical protein